MKFLLFLRRESLRQRTQLVTVFFYQQGMKFMLTTVFKWVHYNQRSNTLPANVGFIW